ncbi:NUDIX hydrolase [Corallococcus exiguus]|uniref:NUDIX hydrolase n=1 Tax=Corallococcus exiguus TaxID=83462 RepID=UPI0034CD726D
MRGARELREEVGLQVPATSLRVVCEPHHRDEFKRDSCHFVEMELDTEPQLVLDQREVVWARWMDVETALRLPLMPVVRAYLEDAARRRGLVPSCPPP